MLFHFLATMQNLDVLKNIKLDGQDFDKILVSYISDKRIFTDLMKVIMKMPSNNLFNSSRRTTNAYLELKDTPLVVDKQAVYYEFRRVFTLYIVTGF